MTRLFAQHRVRRTNALNGRWELFFPRTGSRIEPHGRNEERTDAKRVPVEIPGVWESLAERVNYRGQAVACRRFETHSAGPLRVVFKGVSHTARVLLDGRELGTHHNAFTPFAVEIAHVAAGTHELAVHVSNEHGEISGLHIPNDYYNYGGITRPVELQRPSRTVFVRRCDATPKFDATRGEWRLECRVVVANLGDPERVDVRVAIRNSAEGAASAEAEQAIPGVAAEHGDTEVRVELSLRGARPWYPATPELYLLEATLARDGGVFDDWWDRFGLRTLRCDGERVLLNGEPMTLIGFNRHEDHPLYGCALPSRAMRTDLALILGANANAVRTSHYPNDERFLDLCDELGVLVWEENHARGQSLEMMQHPRFRDQCYAVTGEMVREHVNHPCIVTWGVMNECASQAELGREMYAEQFALIKKLDPSRPTTFASCRHSDDICQDLPDICGWNVYPRWYLEREPIAYLDELIARFEPRGMANKPLIVSETGAGALPGYRDPIRRAKWSEERQATVLSELVHAYADHPRVMGLFIWQFCDVRVDESWAYSRPRCMNNKGVVDEYRRPKLGYDAVRTAFGDKLQRIPAALRPRGT